jgi:hypothetical protein
MMVVGRFVVVLLATACFAWCQKAPERPPNFSPETETFPLWEHGAPGALGSGDQDIPTITSIRHSMGPGQALRS